MHNRWFALSVSGLLFNVVFLAVVWVPGIDQVAQALIFLPFLAAFLSVGSALYVVNGSWLGHLSSARVWTLLGVLPRWAKVVLGLLLVATVAQLLTPESDASSGLGFERTFVAIGVWLAACGTAVHYAVQLEGDEPGPPRRGHRIFQVVVVLAGVGLAIAMFALGRDG